MLPEVKWEKGILEFNSIWQTWIWSTTDNPTCQYRAEKEYKVEQEIRR